MAEVMIPPWVLPESPETIRWLDDASAVFQPAFGRGMTQRSSWGDPRWGLTRRYRGLRSDQLATIRSCLNESRGQLNRILVTPHALLRGSFPATELLTNPTFGSGTTGWSTTNSAFSVTDRLGQLTVSAVGAAVQLFQSVSLTQYAPHVLRVFLGNSSSSLDAANIGPLISDGVVSTTNYSRARGLVSAVMVPVSTASTAQSIVVINTTTGYTAGSYLLVPFGSLARCALVDNGPNLLLNSDDLTGTGWSTSALSVSANSIAAPDGTTTADSLIESSATASHFIQQTSAVAAAVEDISFGVALKLGNRQFVRIRLIESLGSTAASVYFDLTNGLVGTIANGANWLNTRAFITSMGNGWYTCHVVSRKNTGGATSVTAVIGLATADGTDSYTGTGSNLNYAWRATLAQSSVPTRLVASTSSAVPATAQTGGGIFVKGLPASTSGLLEVGDWFETGLQLKQTTSRLTSDAAGLGFLRFRPALGDSPADNDPVIINQPFGRFMYGGQTKELQNLFGLYGDIEMQLEEVYS